MYEPRDEPELREGMHDPVRLAEHGSVTDSDASEDWHAASRQALDRAYKLRNLVEQDWLTPETSHRPALEQ